MIAAIVCTLIALILIAFLLITHRVVKKSFPRVRYPDGPTPEKRYLDYSQQYRRIPCSFNSGKNRLQGYVYGDENGKGLIVFAHGIGTGHENYLRELLWMVDHGWRVLAYDATGSCESEGEGTKSLVQSALDLDAALCFVESDASLRELPVCLLGHSWGGYAVTAGLRFSHRVTASASIAGYAYPQEMMVEFAKNYMGRGVAMLAPFVWIEQKFSVGRYASLSAIDGINQKDVPVLLIHGTEDEVISFGGASIVAHSDRIKNKNVKILVLSDEGQAGHGSIFYHKDSVMYIRKTDDAWKSLCKIYKDVSSCEAKEQFLSGVDREIYNRPNEALLSKIEAFFSASIEKREN